MLFMLMVLVHVLIQKRFCPEDFVTEATFPLDAAVLVPSRILHTIPVMTPAGCLVERSQYMWTFMLHMHVCTSRVVSDA